MIHIGSPVDVEDYIQQLAWMGWKGWPELTIKLLFIILAVNLPVPTDRVLDEDTIVITLTSAEDN